MSRIDRVVIICIVLVAGCLSDDMEPNGASPVGQDSPDDGGSPPGGEPAEEMPVANLVPKLPLGAAATYDLGGETVHVRVAENLTTVLNHLGQLVPAVEVTIEGTHYTALNDTSQVDHPRRYWLNPTTGQQIADLILGIETPTEFGQWFYRATSTQVVDPPLYDAALLMGLQLQFQAASGTLEEWATSDNSTFHIDIESHSCVRMNATLGERFAQRIVVASGKDCQIWRQDWQLVEQRLDATQVTAPLAAPMPILSGRAGFSTSAAPAATLVYPSELERQSGFKAAADLFVLAISGEQEGDFILTEALWVQNMTHSTSFVGPFLPADSFWRLTAFSTSATEGIATGWHQTLLVLPEGGAIPAGAPGTRYTIIGPSGVDVPDSTVTWDVMHGELDDRFGKPQVLKWIFEAIGMDDTHIWIFGYGCDDPTVPASRVEFDAMTGHLRHHFLDKPYVNGLAGACDVGFQEYH